MPDLDTNHGEVPSTGQELLAFALGEELFAVPLQRVRQILERGTLTPIPSMPPFVAGLCSFDGQPVPVIDLGRKFGLTSDSAEADAETAVLIVDALVEGEATIMGIRVDRLADLVDGEMTSPVPPVGSRLRAEFVHGVVRSGEGFTLVVDLDRMLTASEIEVLEGLASDSDVTEATSEPASALAQHPIPSALTAAQPAAATASPGHPPLLLFSMGGLPLAAPLGRITEILEWLPVTPVPGTPVFVRGAANVRGAVVPVVDLAVRFGRPEAPVTEHSCLLVTETEVLGEPVLVALVADAVEQVIEGDEAVQSAVPEFGTPIPPQLLSGLVRQGGEFVPVLDLDRALDGSVLRAETRRD